MQGETAPTEFLATVQSLCRYLIETHDRDYDVQQNQYQALSKRLGVAELSESAEQSDNDKFRIVDPPRVPDKPAAPDRPLLLSLALAVGLGAAATIGFMGNQIKPVFHNTKSLRQVTGLPVLGIVSKMRPSEHRSRRIWQLGAFGAATSILFVAFGILLLIQDVATRMFQSILMF